MEAAFCRLYTSLYAAYHEYYGGVDGASLVDLCVNRGIDCGVDIRDCGGSDGALAPKLRLQIIHGLASSCASTGTGSSWGLGFWRDTDYLAGGDCGRNGPRVGAGEVRPIAISGVPIERVGRGDGAIDATETTFGLGGAGPARADDGGVPSVARMSVGPNYARNVATRQRRKALRAAKKAGTVDRTPDEIVEVDCAKTVEERKLRELKVKRQIIQEERKLKKLQSPEQILEDAMRQVTFAERCAKMANNSKVAGWAATISTAHSESIARSAPSSVPSLASVTSARSASVVESNAYTIGKMPPNAVEEAAIKAKVMTHSDLVVARTKVRRALVRDDFFMKSAPAMSVSQKAEIQEAAYYESKYGKY